MLGPNSTINSPANIMVRLAITPSVSWRCPAREVPKPWAAFPEGDAVGGVETDAGER